MDPLRVQQWRIKRLKLAIESITHGNVTAFGRLLGYQDGAFVRQMLMQMRPISEKTVAAIERIPRLAGWFDSAHPAAAKAAPGTVLTYDTPDELLPDGDRIWLDRFDYRFSAGEGLLQWEFQQGKALPFEVSFFRALGVRPKDCRLAQVEGRSMEPYLFHRDLMLICTARAQVRDGAIYAVLFEEEALVKQIFKEPKGVLRLHSYNPEFPDRMVTARQLDRLTIVGEVMYRAGAGLACSH